MAVSTKESLLLWLRRIGFRLSPAGTPTLPRTLLRRTFRHAHTEVTVTDFDHDLTMKLSLSEHMQRRIFWMGYYSENIIAVLDRLLTPGMTVVDAGANIGEISMIAGKRVGKSGTIIAFEPINTIANQLERHVLANHLNQITIVRMALGDAVMENTPIYASCGQLTGDEHQGLGSLYGADQGQAPLDRIKMTTLDAWVTDHPLERLDLMKIDIEGAELACLRGAEASLRRFRPQLIIEIQDFSAARAGHRSTDILNFLSALNYRFHRIGKGGTLSPLTPDTLLDYQNVLCLPRSNSPVPS